MNRLRFFAGAFGLFMGAILNVPGADTVLVQVTGTRVNLRAQPELESEVIGQVNEGDFLVAKSFSGEWVEVLPPEGTEAWIHREFIQGNKVSASQLNIRAGAGINYTVIGKLSQGDEVKIRGEFGEWVSIEPPPGCSVWVSQSLVRKYEESADASSTELPGPALTDEAQGQVGSEATIRPAGSGTPDGVLHGRNAAGRDASARPSARVPSTEEGQLEPDEGSQPAQVGGKKPYGFDLVPLEGQGLKVQKEGVLKKVGFVFGKPANFKLMDRVNGRDVLVCYVHGNTRQLLEFVGQRMKIKGAQYWVKGVTEAVLVPEQIGTLGQP